MTHPTHTAPPTSTGESAAPPASGADAAPAPTAFVLFGATGDLAARLVLPAFAALAAAGGLPERWSLIGNGRGEKSDDEYRERVREVLGEDSPIDDASWPDFAARIRFAGGGFTEDDPGTLLDVLGEVREDLGEDAQVVHYLALPPSTFGAYTRALAAHGLTEGSRVVFEKPYGASHDGFEELEALVADTFEAEQVFRIDHFLGKEATQQLHVVRHTNRWLEQLWSHEHIAQVQIDVPEELDVADRAEFYDETGATLDMLVTHLLQVAAEIAMEPPAGPAAADLVAAREGVLAAFRPIDPAEAVLGQVEGYRDLEGVADDSTTDTYTAARVWVDTDRWHGVPFLLRSGKQLAGSAQRVSLVLRRPEHEVAGLSLGADGEHVQAIELSLSGDGELAIGVTAQRPGTSGELTDGRLVLQLPDLPGAEPLPAYAALLRDVLAGDRGLFTGSEGLRETWRIVDRLVTDRPEVQPYPAGSWGPSAGDELPGAVGWLTRRP